MADIATASKTITLSPLESLDDLQKVTVNIRVVELKDETQVGGIVKLLLTFTVFPSVHTTAT